ncbi:MAG TPA: indole-3-glycerol phosphate synthase TrpC [Alphaproteobacteria bacterium]|nr:indole-3-glycerol phosphate synthase TrpC [Alphaproteobacteria bacterium]
MSDPASERTGDAANTLARICADKGVEIAARKAAMPLDEIERMAADTRPPRGFARALKDASAARGVGLIAEIKKASPSEGLIRADFEPATLAKAYEAGGAACLSVLTETKYFQGEDTHLGAARAACALPLLRKDFMLDPYQVVEARALGADCILIIMAAVGDELARELADAAAAHGLDALVEVHDAAELARALDLPCPLIGINNRDLKTLATDLAVTERLAADVPEGRFLVAESGIHAPGDVERLRKAGARGFLVGTALMRQADVTAATRALLAPAAATAET